MRIKVPKVGILENYIEVITSGSILWSVIIMHDMSIFDLSQQKDTILLVQEISI